VSYWMDPRYRDALEDQMASDGYLVSFHYGGNEEEFYRIYDMEYGDVEDFHYIDTYVARMEEILGTEKVERIREYY